MKRTILMLKIAVTALALTAAALALLLILCLPRGAQHGNYTEEMKLPYAVNLNDEGANAVERQGDHASSRYFYQMDFYNAQSTDSLTILPRFKTIQQTAWWSCGVSATLMALNYYGQLGDWNEESCAALRSDHSALHAGTCLDQMMEMLRGAGNFALETTYDYQGRLDEIDCAWFKARLRQGYPILIGWNDWGGHWQVAIGYDDMGTAYAGDDVLIVADPFDTTDHNQDGYGVYGMERFLYNFTFYDFFPQGHARDKCFIVVKPAP